MPIRTIQLTHLTRVEGHGGVTVSIQDQKVKEVRLRLYEPPRYFEEILRGRAAHEAIDITARICGICPVAYQITAALALEQGLGRPLSSWTKALRRLLYCGEWIESHALHLFLLHLPDYFGLPDVAALARVDPDLVHAGLRIKKTGNAIISTLAGREIHPVNVTLGGFYRPSDLTALETLAPQIEGALADCEMVREKLRRLEIPPLERTYRWVSLRDGHAYPMACELVVTGGTDTAAGRVVSSDGLDVAAYDFEETISEYQMEGSNARYSRLKDGGPYLCGPMARLALNYDLLDGEVQREAQGLGVAGGTSNPFKSILVRYVEIFFALREAKRLLALLMAAPMGEGCQPHAVPAGSYRAATEAPRGLLYHRYDVGPEGQIVAARLIPPTAQNQATMEEDLRAMMETHRDATDSEIESLCERVVRNHDPCISCAAHFLRVTRVGNEAPPLESGVL